MTRDELRAAVMAALTRIAPEIEPGALDTASPLRDQVDLDSVDFMNVLVAIDRDLGVSVPETDYGKIPSIDACVDYLAAHGAARRAGSGAPAGKETGAG
jgi:acyl carrier protein